MLINYQIEKDKRIKAGKLKPKTEKLAEPAKIIEYPKEAAKARGGKNGHGNKV